jgi:hypothetical protein
MMFCHDALKMMMKTMMQDRDRDHMILLKKVA